MVDYSSDALVLINNIGVVRMTAPYSNVCGNQEVDGGEYDMKDLRANNLAKLKFVSVVNGQFAISESQLKLYSQVVSFKSIVGKIWFSGSANVKGKLAE
ncbi:hypothetical protein AVEN_100452-1 [Araneus ventricosus]|uniref:Uncharacterized protein n=1 Tax=Araneus ventricosus TaxID=182803 RepID=A0A4Y2D0B2_ARAVE|nr:hypothetical protein AVEN_100452-1 [Araneus ventricosus]